MAPRALALFALLSSATTLSCEPREGPIVQHVTRTPTPPPQPSSPLPPPMDPPPRAELPNDVRPVHYTLSLEIVPERDRYAGTVEIAATLDRPRDVIWMHASKDIAVKQASARLAGGAPIFGQLVPMEDGGVAALKLASPIEAGNAFIRIDFEAPFGARGEGLYKQSESGKAYAFTQFESTFARDAFPCFDQPGFKTPFDVTLFVPTGAAAIANTRQIERVPSAAGLERVKFATTAPLPTYLVAFAVGPLDVVDAPPIPPNAIRKRPLPFRGVAVSGRGKDLAAALAETPKIVAALEEYTGIEYPWDKLDVIAEPGKGGAMENAGALTFGEHYLLMNANSSPEVRRDMSSVMAHELAHQWFGDLVTMRWWDDTWLNESFATWLGNRTLAKLHPELRGEWARVSPTELAMIADSRVSARRIHEPVVSANDIVNAFDTITYLKGGAVLRMFEEYAGVDTFEKGAHAYLEEHRFGNATADDFLRAESAAKGGDLATPFKTFLDQPGVPFVEVAMQCDGKRARARLKQSRYLPLGSTGDPRGLWQVPVCMKIGSKKSVATETCTLLDKPEMDWDLGSECPTWVMPNARGAGYYRFSLAPADAKKLADAIAELTPMERLVFATSARASFAHGTMRGDDLAASLAKLTTDKEPSVAMEYGDFLKSVWPWFDSKSLASLRALDAKAYAPIFHRVGFEAKAGAAETVEDREERTALVENLALFAGDAAVKKEAAARGKKLLGVGGDGKMHFEADAPELQWIDMAAAIDEAGAPAFDAAVTALFASEDENVRRALLLAIGGANDPSLAAKARALTLDPRLRRTEILWVLTSQLERPETFEGAFEFVEKNADAIFALLPPRRVSRSFRMFGHVCDAAHEARVKAILEPRLARFEGAPRDYANAIEAIDLCMARRSAHGAELEELVQGRGKHH